VDGVRACHGKGNIVKSADKTPQQPCSHKGCCHADVVNSSGWHRESYMLRGGENLGLGYIFELLNTDSSFSECTPHPVRANFFTIKIARNF